MWCPKSKTINRLFDQSIVIVSKQDEAHHTVHGYFRLTCEINIADRNVQTHLDTSSLRVFKQNYTMDDHWVMNFTTLQKGLMITVNRERFTHICIANRPCTGLFSCSFVF